PTTAPSVAPTPNPRVRTLRNQMLTLLAACVAFGLLVGLVAWRATVTTQAAYQEVVEQDAATVDAALQARAASLDHMSEAATYLATGDASAVTRAQDNWTVFNTQMNILARNLGQEQGEPDVYAAATASARDYLQLIGAMYHAYATESTTRTASSQVFLSAR